MGRPQIISVDRFPQMGKLESESVWSFPKVGNSGSHSLLNIRFLILIIRSEYVIQHKQNNTTTENTQLLSTNKDDHSYLVIIYFDLQDVNYNLDLLLINTYVMIITKFYSKRLRNAELLSLSNDVLTITNSYDWTVANVLNLQTWVQESNTEFKNQLNKLGTVNETQAVKIADDAFNDSWRALKYVVKACMLSPVAAERASAAILNELINTHGSNLHNESYQVQNATAKLFLNDCANKPEIKAALTAIKLDVYIANMQTSLDVLFAAIALRKDKKVSELNDNETHEIRIRLTDNLIKMFKYLEVMSDISPGGDLDTMIKQINLSIQKIEIAIKKRTNKSQELEEVEIS
ncbi:DUF6261 family protein [Ancylomarina sp.]|uniref:DUF6261 family protein n=1 Tax=Ancylomarina sp. TaxID=1970196 RepID=UPI003562758C